MRTRWRWATRLKFAWKIPGSLDCKAAPRHMKLMVHLSFAGHTLTPLCEGAVYWPSRRALLVADLHFEKASYYARFGQMLPPYDSLATLSALTRLVTKTDAAEVWCLGDSFHDALGAQRMSADARAIMAELSTRTRLTWITGNHDPMTTAPARGNMASEAGVDGLLLRHEAVPGESRPEISGHFHPKISVRLRGRRINRRCFVLSTNKLILPAFGAFAGGLQANDPAILSVADGPAYALVPSGDRLLRFPLAA